jgi:hypothetical protein
MTGTLENKQAENNGMDHFIVDNFQQTNSCLAGNFLQLY